MTDVVEKAKGDEIGIIELANGYLDEVGHKKGSETYHVPTHIISKLLAIVEAQEWNPNMDEAPKDYKSRQCDFYDAKSGNSYGQDVFWGENHKAWLYDEDMCDDYVVISPTHWKHKSLPPIVEEKK